MKYVAKYITVFSILVLVPFCFASVTKESDKSLHSGGGQWGFKKASSDEIRPFRILLIGDSVMNGYQHDVAKDLADLAACDVWLTPAHLNSNGIRNELEKIVSGEQYDVIHFNIGLHGWVKGRIPDGQYEPLLRQYVDALMKAAGDAKLIWASTTPIMTQEKPRNFDPENNPTIIDRNKIAAKVMSEKKIVINDLYSAVSEKLDIGTDKFHWSSQGKRIQADHVVRSIMKNLNVNKPGQTESEFSYVDVPSRTPKGFVWESEIPQDCPFEQSDLFNRIYFTGRFSDYMCGDTFYPSWASDGNLYSPWTDGSTDGMISQSYWGEGAKATTGHAAMIGDDPLSLTIKNTSPPKIGSALPYQGRYPAGSLVHNGIWYYATYCLTSGYPEQFANPKHNEFSYNWPVLGPTPGFQISYDLGKTWKPSPLTPAEPLFPEPKKNLGTVKMGVPHFVDFGKNMEHSPDGKAYLLGMGAEDNDPEPRPCIKPAFGKPYEISDECPDENFKHGNLSWISADQVYLSRVTPSPETINDIKSYEFFAGHDAAGKPIWSNNFDDIKPLIEWNNNMGCVTATYVPALKKYLMCITDGWPTTAKMDSYILEADTLTGPWRIISYMKDFGEQAYFLNFPSKFISNNGKDMWLCYSANFSSGRNGYHLKFKPEGGRYGLCLHEMRFLSKNDKDPSPAKVEKVDIFAGNIAPKAEITVSSTHKAHSPKALVDGVIAGFPENDAAEWASNAEKEGAWLKLEWEKKQQIDRVLLFDRPAIYEQVQSGLLIFSDGSFIHVDKELPTSAYAGLEIKFKPKNVNWIKFIVLKPGWRTANSGLSEIAVFAADQ